MKRLQTIRVAVQVIFMLLFAVGLITKIPYAMTTIILLGILLGPIFCGFVCPFGFMQDLSSRLGKTLRIKQRQMPKKCQKFLVFTRYIIFLLVGVSGVQIIFQLLGYDPRVNFLKVIDSQVVSLGAIMTIIIFLVIGVFFKRPFCNYFCYEGAKYGLMGVARPFRVKRNESSCVNCKICDKVCPMNIEISTNRKVNSLQCVNCYECVSSCPVENTLKVVPIIDDVKSFNRSIKNGELKARLRGKVTKKNIFVVTCGILILGLLLILGQRNKPFPEYINTQAVVATGAEVETSDAVGFEDGVYTGQAEGFNGIIKTDVTIENERIKSIAITSHQDDARWFNHANGIIPNEIIANQTTKVDTVTMATYSSSGIINSVKNALGQKDYIVTKDKRKHRH
ncbi:4Fe-4S binding protein [Wukongibacter baidiensis]|uniref:4Fe-4S binding protein n=1 Tax=Wukongibacter baidiensis TaxID=1723361 RepID=UPI003D7F80DC